MSTANRTGTLPLAGLVLTVMALSLAVAALAHAESPEVAPPRVQRDIDFYGWWHDAGRLWLHTTNLGFFGNFGLQDGPSAEWPDDSGYEHLYVSGLWVGATAGGDTLVSTSVYDMEFNPPRHDPAYAVYSSEVGAPGGRRSYDDDGDALVDEDRLDGLDNDHDGLIDEDYAAISDEMFAYASFDTTTLPYPNPYAPHTAMGLELYVQSFAWNDEAAGDFVGVRYEITNISASTLNDVYVGIMADPDVGFAGNDVAFYGDDMMGFADVMVGLNSSAELVRVVMAYAYDAPGGEDGDWNGWFGVALLGESGTGGSSPSPRAFRRWFSGADDPTDDIDRYALLSQPVIEGGTTEANDWRFVMSVGPFDEIAPGETAFVDVAYVCGDKLQGLIDNAAHAVLRHRSKLWSGTSGPLPGRPLAALPKGPSLRESGRAAALLPPSPNPVSYETRVAFELADAGHARLTVYDCAGRRVTTLVNRELGAGLHQAEWSDGVGALPAGIYFMRLEAAGEASTTKVVVMH